MKPYLWLVLWLFCLLVGVTGCDSLRQEVYPDELLRAERKLVITCFISPQDTVLAAKVVQTVPILDTAQQQSVVSNATVTLAGGGRSTTLRYDPHRQHYRASPQQCPIVPGTRYTLTVKTPDGRQATGQCVVPPVVRLASAVLDSTTLQQDNTTGRTYFVRLRWQDPASQRNYYRPAGTFTYARFETCTTCQSTNQRQTRFEALPIDFRSDNQPFSVISDKQANGRVISSGEGQLGEPRFGDPRRLRFTALYPLARVTVNLLSIDENYFRYYEAVEYQRATHGNPFAEPVLIPANLKGALGCFGAYNNAVANVRVR